MGQGVFGVQTTAKPRSQQEKLRDTGMEHFVQPGSFSPAPEQTPPPAARRLGINLSVLVNYSPARARREDYPALLAAAPGLSRGPDPGHPQLRGWPGRRAGAAWLWRDPKPPCQEGRQVQAVLGFIPQEP